MIRISASLISDYIACPRRAYYRIVVPEESQQTVGMYTGSIVHNVIEKNTFKPYNVLLEESNKEIEKCSVTVDVHKIRTCLDNFETIRNNELSGVITPAGLPELKFNVNINGVHIVGKFDRIDNNHVFDWKTEREDPVDLSRNVQFILYYLCYKQLYGKTPTVYYVNLINKHVIMYKPDNKYITELLYTVIPHVYNNLLNGKNTPRVGLFNYRVCQNCSFYNYCRKELEGGE